MKTTLKKALLFLLLISPPLMISAQQDDVRAKEIVQKSFNLYLGKSSFSVMQMTIVRPSWTRTITMQNWSMGDDYYITYVTAPARDKGQVFLKNKKDMWNFVPAINRNIKIPPSMMMQSWMGSDFTNNDLMKQKSIVTDYTHQFSGNENIGNYNCHIIKLTPLPEAAVIWGKILLWINKQHLITLKAEYYDTHNRLIKTQTASDIKTMGGRLLPAHMEMISNTKKGNKTIIDISHQEFNVKGLTPSFFSIQQLKQLRPRKL